MKLLKRFSLLTLHHLYSLSEREPPTKVELPQVTQPASLHPSIDVELGGAVAAVRHRAVRLTCWRTHTICFWDAPASGPRQWLQLQLIEVTHVPEKVKEGGKSVTAKLCDLCAAQLDLTLCLDSSLIKSTQFWFIFNSNDSDLYFTLVHSHWDPHCHWPAPQTDSTCYPLEWSCDQSEGMEVNHSWALWASASSTASD